MTRVTYLLIFLFFTCSSLTIQAQPSYSSADSRVRSYIHTLPESLFRRLIPDLLLISQYENSLETLPSYKKRTRWYPKHSIPKMPIEEAIARLIRLVEPLFPEGTPLVGAEWWTQYISSDAPLGFHVDKDESIATHKHYLVHPIWSSVFYMSESGGGTLIPNQYSPNGNGYDPVQPNEGEWSFPTPNKFLLFRGNLLHGVIPGSTSREKRLTFLINFWSVVPEPPNCELLRYSDVKGLRTYSDDEMEAWRQEWDDDRSEKRLRQALARVDMTEGTSVPHFVYKIVLPGGATEDVRLPKTTTPGQTYTITWNSGSSKSSKSTSPSSSSSSSSSSTPNIADIVSQAARSQSAKQKKAKKKKSEKKQKKIKIEDDEEDENDTDERTNDTSTRTHSSSSTKTSTQTSTSPPPSASIPPPRARSKSRVREAKNDLVRRIKDEL